MTHAPEFKFPLGSFVRPVGGHVLKWRVVAHIIYLDGSVGFVCSEYNHHHGVIARHTVGECEIEAVPA